MKSLLQDYVSAQAQRRSEATAVVADDQTLTYGELDSGSNQLARLLRESGCSRGDRIALLAPKSAAAIVATLGIYKSDCIYVPLDSTSPAPRLVKMIESAEPKWILAAGPVAQLLGDMLASTTLRARMRVGWLEPRPISSCFPIDFDRNDLLNHSAAPVNYRNQTHDAAHLLFTSGSTGIPKGVIITHGNVIHFIEWAIEYFGINSTDRQSCHPPLHFDLSVFDIFGTLAAGATLYLVPPDLSLFPNKLADFIRGNALTQWFSVPSLLTYMANLDVVRPNDFPCLKRLLWCGEVLPTRTLIYWMQRLPHVIFTNLYGPTEATIASSYYTLPAAPKTETQPIPIGSPCGGETLHVLDADLHPVPRGIQGDLYIGGVGLSPGYWRNAEATDAVFVTIGNERLYRTGDLASIGTDGQVYFHGRSDSQVKTRGHRVELGEIEAALDCSSRLQSCAVVAIPSSGFEGNTICCAYVAKPDQTVTPATLRKELAGNLPAYMVPTEWLELSSLPKNANGKVDRAALKNEFRNRSKPPAPQHAALGSAEQRV